MAPLLARFVLTTFASTSTFFKIVQQDDSGVDYPMGVAMSLLSDLATRDYHGLDLLVVREYVRDILMTFSDDRELCAAQLNGMFCRSEPVIIDEMFASMFKLPRSEARTIFYGSCILTLCGMNSGVHRPLGQAMNQVFLRCDELDIETLDTFVEWFTMHISNTDFKWPWSAWGSVIKKPADSRQRILVQELLKHSTLLSFPDRIKATVPEDFEPLVPVAEPHVFRFDDSGDAPDLHKKLAATLVAKIKAKAPGDELAAAIDSATLFEEPVVKVGSKRGREYDDDEDGGVHGDDGEEEDEDDDEDMSGRKRRRGRRSREGLRDPDEVDEIRRAVLFESILHVGSKSYSHIVNILDRYAELLKDSFSNAGSRLHMMKMLAAAWRGDRHMTSLICEKLLSSRIVDPHTIIEWVLADDDNSPELTQRWLWIIFFTTIDRTMLRTQIVEKKLRDVSSEAHNMNGPSMQARPTAGEDTVVEPNGDSTENEQQQREEQLADQQRKQRETELARLQTDLEECLRDQKEMFLIIFQRFCMALTDHLADHPGDTESLWFKTLSQRLIQTGRRYHRHISPIVAFLASYIFGDAVDDTVRALFDHVKEVCAAQRERQFSST